eukprot:750429-Hanusia_phi.AAC.2
MRSAVEGNFDRSLHSYHLCVRLSVSRLSMRSGFYKRMVATCMNDAGNVYLALGRSDRALVLFRKAFKDVKNTILAPTAITNVAATARQLCDWSDWDEVILQLLATIQSTVRNRRAIVIPYLVETYRLDPSTVLRLSEVLSEETFDQVNPSVEHACERAKGLQKLQLELHDGGKKGGGGGGGGGQVHIGFYSVTGLNAARLSIGRFLQSVIALHKSSETLRAFCYGDVEHDDGTRIYSNIAQGCSAMKSLGGMPFKEAMTETEERSSRPAEYHDRPDGFHPVRPSSLSLVICLGLYILGAPDVSQVSFSHPPPHGGRCCPLAHLVVSRSCAGEERAVVGNAVILRGGEEGRWGGGEEERRGEERRRRWNGKLSSGSLTWIRWGYTGTLGADFVHYIATDVKSSPPERCYSCCPRHFEVIVEQPILLLGEVPLPSWLDVLGFRPCCLPARSHLPAQGRGVSPSERNPRLHRAEDGV